jgi:protein SCO1/2
LIAATAILSVWTAGDASLGAVAPPAANGPAPAAAVARSIYALDLDLVDQHGRRRTLNDLRGRPVVATMLYTSCVSVCPTVTAEMKAIERLLPERLRQSVTFAVFSLDPGRDTPQALQAFGAAHGLDPARWQLFAASADGVRLLSVVLGVSYRPDTDGGIAHAAVIVAIDPDGVVRLRQAGLGRDPRPLIAALEGLTP